MPSRSTHSASSTRRSGIDGVALAPSSSGSAEPDRCAEPSADSDEDEDEDEDAEDAGDAASEAPGGDPHPAVVTTATDTPASRTLER
ncbi:hypothetical protein [Mobilicoccus caccae]|uniref:hypothetical protein n=1 Tax=Mobilicoccus caccae TaxID=1859295 RepID=UPI0024E0444A|nr:hypothetical protein [Mobilicoccus caccae]